METIDFIIHMSIAVALFGLTGLCCSLQSRIARIERKLNMR